MKILITGGHLAPALAVIEEIKATRPDTEIIFVGRKYSLDSEKTISLEYKEMERRKILFVPLQAGRLTRVLSIKSLRSFFRVPLGFYRAFFIVKDFQPDIIFSFGGYLALPIVFWASIFKKPIFTHEQTINPGTANKIIARFAKKIFVAFESTKRHFPNDKTIVTGNPLRKSAFKIIKRPLIINKNKPVIYITGGSLGSHSINVHIEQIILKLVKDFIVIHQTGDTKEYQDFEKLQEIKNSLTKDNSERYILVKHFFETEIGYIYSLSDLVIGRAGANTFFELLQLKIPAIFIPLPWSSGREQQHHAEIFARNGIGEIFHQIETSDKLYRLIVKMIKNIDYYRDNFKSLSYLTKKNASQYIVNEIFKNN
jgi:UDP-N-acetylglucosamine--N-acetylmuramyl-(pentapeptide) pyrophosphoryl-undecaprenol N-acetylglucosamine transferase